ncbi:hypothetical protein H4R33_001275 [Dimargaris cristalligena]|nr:hypothetical protein H4R33_001275 [Dimargaris cristalligena]
MNPNTITTHSTGLDTTKDSNYQGSSLQSQSQAQQQANDGQLASETLSGAYGSNNRAQNEARLPVQQQSRDGQYQSGLSRLGNPLDLSTHGNYHQQQQQQQEHPQTHGFHTPSSTLDNPLNQDTTGTDHGRLNQNITGTHRGHLGQDTTGTGIGRQGGLTASSATGGITGSAGTYDASNYHDPTTTGLTNLDPSGHRDRAISSGKAAHVSSGNPSSNTPIADIHQSGHKNYGNPLGDHQVPGPRPSGVNAHQQLQETTGIHRSEHPTTARGSRDYSHDSTASNAYNQTDRFGGGSSGHNANTKIGPNVPGIGVTSTAGHYRDSSAQHKTGMQTAAAEGHGSSGISSGNVAAAPSIPPRPAGVSGDNNRSDKPSHNTTGSGGGLGASDYSNKALGTTTLGVGANAYQSQQQTTDDHPQQHHTSGTSHAHSGNTGKPGHTDTPALLSGANARPTAEAPKPSLGDRIKGVALKAAGSLTGNEAKKEEGQQLKSPPATINLPSSHH